MNERRVMRNSPKISKCFKILGGILESSRLSNESGVIRFAKNFKRFQNFGQLERAVWLGATASSTIA